MSRPGFCKGGGKPEILAARGDLQPELSGFQVDSLKFRLARVRDLLKKLKLLLSQYL